MAKRDRRYNDTSLMPPEFLLEVMRDTCLPLSTRMDAAVAFLKQEHEAGALFIAREPWPGERRITFVIHGLEPVTAEPEAKVQVH
jgi:hypothetical protein